MHQEPKTLFVDTEDKQSVSKFVDSFIEAAEKGEAVDVSQISREKGGKAREKKRENKEHKKGKNEKEQKERKYIEIRDETEIGQINEKLRAYSDGISIRNLTNNFDTFTEKTFQSYAGENKCHVKCEKPILRYYYKKSHKTCKSLSLKRKISMKFQPSKEEQKTEKFAYFMKKTPFTTHVFFVRMFITLKKEYFTTRVMIWPSRAYHSKKISTTERYNYENCLQNAIGQVFSYQNWEKETYLNMFKIVITHLQKNVKEKQLQSVSESNEILSSTDTSSLYFEDEQTWSGTTTCRIDCKNKCDIRHNYGNFVEIGFQFSIFNEGEDKGRWEISSIRKKLTKEGAKEEKEEDYLITSSIYCRYLNSQKPKPCNNSECAFNEYLENKDDTNALKVAKITMGSFVDVVQGFPHWTLEANKEYKDWVKSPKVE